MDSLSKVKKKSDANIFVFQFCDNLWHWKIIKNKYWFNRHIRILLLTLLSFALRQGSSSSWFLKPTLKQKYALILIIITCFKVACEWTVIPVFLEFSALTLSLTPYIIMPKSLTLSDLSYLLNNKVRWKDY